MNYEEKLKEAKRLYESANDDQRYVLESLFPELNESDDERIRKGLINGFKECLKNSQYPNNAQKYWHNIKIEDIFSWLEKQGQKPAWSEEDEKMLVDCFNILHRSDYPRDKVTKTVDWLKSLKQRMKGE